MPPLMTSGKTQRTTGHPKTPRITPTCPVPPALAQRPPVSIDLALVSRLKTRPESLNRIPIDNLRRSSDNVSDFIETPRGTES